MCERRVRSRDPISARPWLAPLTVWAVSGIIVFLGAYVGWRLASHDDSAPLAGVFSKFDGGHYARIATAGYTYTPGKHSDLAFFPAYPLIARGVAWLTDAAPIGAC